MNRREFSKLSALALGALALPSYKSIGEYSELELIGKVKPKETGIGGLRKIVADAFLKMKSAAKTQGIDLVVASGYRGYDRQEQIWTSKYKRFTSEGMKPIAAINRIIEYSTIPGTSRHHWGTDVDVIDGSKPRPSQPLAARHFHGGVYSDLKKWLDENANDFGFYIVYTDDKDRKGFKYEPWHLSYKPISYAMLQEYKEIDVRKLLQEMKLVGSQHFTEEFISRYRSENILDINPELL